MMRFKPYPGLTFVTLICLAILIGLGTWQWQRLGWKTQYLAELRHASQAPAFKNLSELERAAQNDEPLDFRRVTFSARFKAFDGEADFLTSSAYEHDRFDVLRVENKTTGWRRYKLVSGNGYSPVFVATLWVPDSQKMSAADDDQPAQSGQLEESYFAGYVRSFEAPSRFAAQSTPELNRWMSFNALAQQASWASAARAGAAVTDYYIDASYIGAAPFAQTLPPRMPDVPNNHFDYMLTWYSFAFILFVIYLLLHIRGNRLTFKSS